MTFALMLFAVVLMLIIAGAARKKKSKTTTPKVTREKELSEDDSDDDRASEDDFMNWDASLNLPNQPCLAYAIEDRAYHPARVTEYHAKGEKYTVVYWNGTQRKLDRKKFFCKWEAGFRECKLTDELPPELKDQDFVDENFQDPELEDKSRRMDLYKQRKNSRLTWIYGAGPLDKNQVNLVASIIEGMLQKWTTGGHAEDLAWVNQYDQNLLVHNVLLAEAIIRLIEATENVCRNDADGKLQLGYKCDWARELVFLKHGSRATSVANGSDGSGGWDVNGRGFGRHNDAGRGGADAVDGVYEASARGRLRVVKNLKE
ncbi:hypothetical protein M427DRAFT_208926 [Gonapodya prolifera JEL478]|uniref:Uncharacterized protein n=1 Tax=Gonapodya prolifera (strain JEL478) TaxID=1344416 RepID=A0A139ANZ4_GONPJ|nr:hypothetical protein M427DRAFT_208926 [Gonapodya prolifera JEL478]|eukprot:KXS18364.1 hypothetical protein M427DRAFT_208926 [Gonapodya prolifera JEL478]